MVNKLKEYFSQDGLDIISDVRRAIRDYSMEKQIRGGVLVGLSGGADSVMLLLTLLYLRGGEDYPIVAVHVNHGIRGEEADRDEEFSHRLCRTLDVEFIAKHLDIPSLAEQTHTGIEEAARNARYSAFEEIKQGRNDIFAIAVAHNADDNLETVIINMLRGSGTRGLSGIPPVRDSIVRPLIYIQKARIVKALDSLGIAYVTDSTNSSDNYTRNYVRHNIVPALRRISDDPCRSVLRMCRNLREDDLCLSGMADDFVTRYKNGSVPSSELIELHPAVLFRVLTLYSASEHISIERVHVDSIRALLIRGGDFTVSVSGGVFYTSHGLCGFSAGREACISDELIYAPLCIGVNELEKYGATVEIFHDCKDFSTKVYNNSTQADLSSAIIEGDLLLRSRKDGDTVFYGGMTRKLKRLFSDAKIPLADRKRIPILTDDKGVVWVPGFGVRDDGGKGTLYARISVYNSAGGAFLLPDRKIKNKKGKKVT